jgi:CDP-diacylglycerol--serine O-phosphatidyltransferase
VAAGLSLMPMILFFLLDDHGSSYAPALRDPVVTGLWALCVAGLAVSHLPTLSSKQIRVSHRMKVPALGIFGLFVAGLINDPWPTLALMGAVYIALMPVGVLHHDRKAKALAEGRADPDDEDQD